MGRSTIRTFAIIITTSVYLIGLISHIVYSRGNLVELEELYIYVCRNNFLTYILYGEQFLERFKRIHFTIGTDVEVTVLELRFRTT